MPLLEIIRQKLIDDTVIASGSCFVGYAPDKPDTIVALNLTGGTPPDTLMAENLRESFQVFIRKGEFEFAQLETLCRAVFNSLDGTVISASNIGMINALASGPLIFQDENRRNCGTLNFQTVRSVKDKNGNPL